MERWHKTAVRSTELLKISEKPQCLKFLTKAHLDRTPVVALLMVMMIESTGKGFTIFQGRVPGYGQVTCQSLSLLFIFY